LKHNLKAIGSFLIGLFSILGVFLIGEGAIISVAGLLIGFLSIKEIKKSKQKGIIVAIIGLFLNGLGMVWLFI
jgi:hypothetical protein